MMRHRSRPLRGLISLLFTDPSDKEPVSKLNPLSAKGAKCNSLGQRPRYEQLKIPSAESAKCVGPIMITTVFIDAFYFAPSALPKLIGPNPGRCPGLLHFAPLALNGLSFDTDSKSPSDFQAGRCADSETRQ